MKPSNSSFWSKAAGRKLQRDSVGVLLQQKDSPSCVVCAEERVSASFLFVKQEGGRENPKVNLRFGKVIQLELSFFFFFHRLHWDCIPSLAEEPAEHKSSAK
jgi:hypothetical protein